MKNLIYSIFFSMLLIASCKDNATVSPEPIDSDSVLTDVRDGYKYSIKMIGTQKWILKNLNASTHQNGDTIRYARTEEEWLDAAEKKEGAWCYYANDPKNGEVYGKLYNWYAVNDSRGLAPSGYHIPSDLEWSLLTEYLGGKESAGLKMKSTSGWANGGNGDNSSGFNGLPGGGCNYLGAFNGITVSGYWWSSSENSATLAWLRGLYYGDTKVYGSNFSKDDGFSVRCLRD